MNVQKLRHALEELGVRPGAASINGLDATEDQYRLEQKDGFWTVYYFERGEMTGTRKFREEEEACSYLLDLLKSDPTTRIAR